MRPKRLSSKSSRRPVIPVGAILSLWIIMNGALAQIIMATRVIFGLRSRGGAPMFLARVSEKTHTPVRATFVVCVVVLALALFFPLKSLASATSLIILLVFAASNAALIVLERRSPDAPFDTPILLPWLGLVVTFLLLAGRFVFGGGGH